jgi:hypothetical protein
MQVDKSNTICESLFQNLGLVLCPSLCRNRVLFQILAQDLQTRVQDNQHNSLLLFQF